jgi:hypothetical protein
VVSPGQSLFGLVDTSKLKLSTTLSENVANLLAEGAQVHIATERGEIVGRVTAILSTLDARTRRVPIVAEFENSAKGAPRLRAGSFVRAWVQSREAISVLRVPHGVLRPGSQDEVLAVHPETSKLELRRVVFSVDPEGALLMRSGIGASDRLVLNPIPEAAAGDLVQVESEAAPAADAVMKDPSPAPALGEQKERGAKAAPAKRPGPSRQQAEAVNLPAPAGVKAGTP